MTEPSHEVKLPEHPVWEKLTFHIPSHPTIYIYPYTHDLERASRENFERETLKKTRLTHPQSLPKRLFKFHYSLPLHCQILERLITKTFSHHLHFSERAVWCFGKQLRRNQFHIGWCYGQVAESGKLEKKQVRRNLVGARRLEGLGTLGRLGLEGLLLFVYPNYIF